MSGIEVGVASEGWEPFLLSLVFFLPVAFTSYRRSRRLSGYGVPRSLLIAYVAGSFWMIWLIVSWVNRDQIAREWRDVRGTNVPAPA